METEEKVSRESHDTESVTWVKASAVPPSRGFGGVSHLTKECVSNLASMEINDIMHIPITDMVKEIMREKTQSRYAGSLMTARKHLVPRRFKVMCRGRDIFVERKA